MPDNEVKTVVGFDLGTHWTGVAVGQTLTAQATPLEAIRSIKQKPNWQMIEQLIKEWQPQILIVGLPTMLDGEPDEMTEAAKKFSRQLHGRFHIDTDLVDERLTTREAYQVVTESGQYKSKPEIDSIAAVIITESWLRSHAEKPNK
ncbi:MAG: Holliday junction resolvase RuvX [Gammaproteobacteria bacterium]|nr:Holliday junction resolvase RuvX [Gammaproteobacteria bacterium]